jgi:hypothetical protein
MKRSTPLILLAALLIALCAAPLGAVDFKKSPASSSPADASGLSVAVELVGERGAVYGSGKNIGISFSASRPAYVVIYNIDSEGYVHLLFPADGRPVRVEGRKKYFLPEPGSGLFWETGGKTGVEYIHALAVEDRSRLDEDELYFLSKSERLPAEKRLRVDLDPFLAFNMIDEEIVRDAGRMPPATAYTYFYINRRVDYPRYLCAKCHGPETIADPYAMECPDVSIERIAYAEEPRYPYPPLYDIRRYGGGDERDVYSSTDDDRYDMDGDDGRDETTVYLSFSYGSYAHPWYSPWPSYGSYFGWGLYPAWDPFWGGFYWNIWWNDYYGWPYYSWWRRPYPYCYGCYYPYWSYGDYWYARYSGSYRPLYGDRSATKRRIDYATTNQILSRERSLADTRLMKTKQREVAQRIDRSDLGRRAVERGFDARAAGQRVRGGGTNPAVDRTTGRDRPAVRGAERSAGTRSGERGRETMERGTTRSPRDETRRAAPPRAIDRDRSGTRPAEPERRPRDADRIAPPPARQPERSGTRDNTTRDPSGSGADKKRTSAGEANRGADRNAAASARSSPPPSRGAERSSSTPYRGASSGTRSNAGKTRTR